METLIKADKPYEGKGGAPEGQRKMNIGDHYYQFINHRRYFETVSTDDNPNASLRLAYQVSKNRHLALMDWYNPRFQKEFIAPDGLLGKGTFGKVWKVQFPSTEFVALKQVEKAVNLEDLWKERDLLILLKHKRIVNLMGAFFDGQMFLVFEMCSFSLKMKARDLKEQNKIRFSIQLLEAIEWIHSKNVVHCDLKSDNILITSSNNLVVADFGAALLLENDNDVIQCTRSRGCFGYQDLESNQNFTYCKSSDIFSMGCILYEIWAGDYLLKYHCNFNNNFDREKDAYISALQSGRITGIRGLKYPFENAIRLPLSVRINKGCPRFSKPISLMTTKLRKDRESAAYFVKCDVIQEERKRLVNKKWKLDNGDDNMATDPAMCDTFEKFTPPLSSTAVQNAAFFGIYYDEMDVAVPEANPVLGKSLLSYDTHVISKFIVRHGLQSLLLPGLATKDPSVLGATQMRILMELVSGLIGQNQLFPADTLQRDAGYQTELVKEVDRELSQTSDAGSHEPLAVRATVSVMEHEKFLIDDLTKYSSIRHPLIQAPETNNLTAADRTDDNQYLTTVQESRVNTHSQAPPPLSHGLRVFSLQHNAPAIPVTQSGQTQGSQACGQIHAPANDANAFRSPFVFQPPPQQLKPPPQQKKPPSTLFSMSSELKGLKGQALTPQMKQTAGAAPATMTSRAKEDTRNSARIPSMNPTNLIQSHANVQSLSVRSNAAQNLRPLKAGPRFIVTPPSDAAIDPIIQPPMDVAQIAVISVHQSDVDSKCTRIVPTLTEASLRGGLAPLEKDSKPGGSTGSTKSADGKSKVSVKRVDNKNKTKSNKKEGRKDGTDKNETEKENDYKAMKSKLANKGKCESGKEDENDDICAKKLIKEKESTRETKARHWGNESTDKVYEDNDGRGTKQKQRNDFGKSNKRSHTSTDTGNPSLKKLKRPPISKAYVDDSSSDEQGNRLPPVCTHECPLCEEKFTSKKSCQDHIDNDCEKNKQRKEAKRAKKALKAQEKKGNKTNL